MLRLIIFPGNFLPHVGGLETHVDEFCDELSKNPNYDITIFSPNVSKGKERERIHKGVKVLRYPAFELTSNYPFPQFWRPKFYSMLFSLYRKDFDIVMTRTRFFSNSTSITAPIICVTKPLLISFSLNRSRSTNYLR